MGYSFVMPETLERELFTILPPKLYMNADDCRWFISTIVRKTAAKDVDNWGYVRLNGEILRRVMHKNRVASIVGELNDHGCIETTTYRAGGKSKGYRLNERYMADRSVRVDATDQYLIERLERERDRIEDNRTKLWKPVHHALHAEQRNLSITDEADEILDRLPDRTRLCQHVLISNIRFREFPFFVSPSGRVFNSITGLKRDFRPTLRLCGEILGCVDIACSQPNILGMLLSNKTPTYGSKNLATYKHTRFHWQGLLPPALANRHDSPADFFWFSSLASGGTLYEVLMSETGMDREWVKKRLMADVLAKWGRYPSEMERTFKRLFPAVYEVIRWVNRKDHGDLIRLLQRAEAWLVLEQVSPRLLGHVPMLSLHDAVYSKRCDVTEVMTAFQGVFKDFGFEMALKAE